MPFPDIDLPLTLLAYHRNITGLALILHERLLREAIVQMLVNKCTLYLGRADRTDGSIVVIALPHFVFLAATVLTSPDVPHHLPRIDATGDFSRRTRQTLTAASTRTRRWSRGFRRVYYLPSSGRVVLNSRPRAHDNCTRLALGGHAADRPREPEACSTEAKDISTATGSSRVRCGRARSCPISEKASDVLLTFPCIFQFQLALARLFLSETY